MVRGGSDELVKVTRKVRGVLNGRVVIVRPGERITRELAAALGLAPPPARTAIPKRPRNAKRPGPLNAKAGRS